MYRIRFHGRGGQGMKTASRMLGTAFFLQGFEVQDAPRYGAERRGAPLFAYVRADRQAINERGIIHHPDLVVVADDTLLSLSAAGVLQGLSSATLLCVISNDSAATWRQRLQPGCPLVVLPAGEQALDRMALKYIGAQSAGAAAALLPVLTRAALQQAVTQELAAMAAQDRKRSLDQALQAFDWVSAHCAERAAEGEPVAASGFTAPAWLDLPFEAAATAVPAVFAAASSARVNTGSWRTLRPVIDYDRCKHCWWICSNYCPDSAIAVADNTPRIDYDHCKGCLICVAQCPPQAITAVAEEHARPPAETAS